MDLYTRNEEVDVLNTINRHSMKKRYNLTKSSRPVNFYTTNGCSTKSGLCMYGQELEWLVPPYAENDSDLYRVYQRGEYMHLKPKIGGNALIFDGGNIPSNRQFAMDRRPKGKITINGFMRDSVMNKYCENLELEEKLIQIRNGY